MFDLLERWAALEPAWCRLDEARISFGPQKDDDWIEWDWEFIPWREQGSLQIAVIAAMEKRDWAWERFGDGTLRVGGLDGLQAVVFGGESFTRDLLNAYVQRLEMEILLLAEKEQ